MKAIRLNNTPQGPLLIVATLPQPQPEDGELLIRVRAAGVTPTESVPTLLCLKVRLIHTGLQPGEKALTLKRNRFNGFHGEPANVSTTAVTSAIELRLRFRSALTLFYLADRMRRDLKPDITISVCKV